MGCAVVKTNSLISPVPIKRKCSHQCSALNNGRFNSNMSNNITISLMHDNRKHVTELKSLFTLQTTYFDTKYNILKKLKKYKFDNIYKIINKKTGDFKLLKIISKHSEPINNNNLSFLENLQTIKSLTNVNKSYNSIIECYEDKLNFYIISEYTKKQENIINYLIKHKIFNDENMLKQILKNLLIAIDVLHENNIFLGANFKFENILIIENKKNKVTENNLNQNPSEEIKIKLLNIENDSKYFNTTNNLFGYNHFFIPEIYSKSKNITKNIDSWNFGILFYFLMTGFFPFFVK